MTRRKIQYWVIPPEADGEYAANMENVLDTYSQPYDERFPVLCMDLDSAKFLSRPSCGVFVDAGPTSDEISVDEFRGFRVGAETLNKCM